jgi:hypothetical protein
VNFFQKFLNHVDGPFFLGKMAKKFATKQIAFLGSTTIASKG